MFDLLLLWKCRMNLFSTCLSQLLPTRKQLCNHHSGQACTPMTGHHTQVALLKGVMTMMVIVVVTFMSGIMMMSMVIIVTVIVIVIVVIIVLLSICLLIS